MSQRGDFQDKRMLSEKLTRKRSEVWLFSFTGRFDTLAFLAVASLIFAHLFAQLVMSVVWRPFFVSGWAKLGISIQNYELWFVTVSVFRPTVKIVETNGATSAEVYSAKWTLLGFTPAYVRPSDRQSGPPPTAGVRPQRQRVGHQVEPLQRLHHRLLLRGLHGSCFSWMFHPLALIFAGIWACSSREIILLPHRSACRNSL